MRSRLLRIGVLALAAFAVMPGTAMALDSAAAVRGPCWTGQCPDVCVPMGTFEVCVLENVNISVNN